MVFFLIVGLRRVSRMNDGTELDYSQLYQYGATSSHIYSSQNILCNYLFADLLVKKGAEIICICGSKLETNITGTNLSVMLNGCCSNQDCAYSTIPQMKKISYYSPLNLTATYLTLVNDTGHRGN